MCFYVVDIVFLLDGFLFIGCSNFCEVCSFFEGLVLFFFGVVSV